MQPTSPEVGIKNMGALVEEIPAGVQTRQDGRNHRNAFCVPPGEIASNERRFPCLHGTTSVADGKREEARKSWAVNVGMRVKILPLPSTPPDYRQIGVVQKRRTETSSCLPALTVVSCEK
jgi:hypothetical protein